MYEFPHLNALALQPSIPREKWGEIPLLYGIFPIESRSLVGLQTEKLKSPEKPGIPNDR